MAIGTYVGNSQNTAEVEIRIGSYASGAPRLQTYSWESCKVANLRPGAKSASRPNLGGKPNTPSVPDQSSTDAADLVNKQNDTPGAAKI